MRIASNATQLPDARPTAPMEGKPGSSRSFAAVLGERRGSSPKPTSAPETAAADRSGATASSPQPTGPVRTLLERVVRTENKVDALLQAAARGKTFSPSELLALQASVFRYSQTVEVVSRVADRLVGAIKQTIGTSV
jgi:hypothetical protein